MTKSYTAPGFWYKFGPFKFILWYISCFGEPSRHQQHWFLRIRDSTTDKSKATKTQGGTKMEEQIAELVAKVAALEAKSNTTNTMFAEAYYYLSIPLMILIHAGFLSYEMGASRMKNVLSSGVKTILAFAFMMPTFWYFGWWVYWGFPTGIPGIIGADVGPNGISGAAYATSIAAPWVEYMGPNITDNASGVFWGAFAMFAATTASIMSGAVIERIQTVGFVIAAIVLGSFSWVVAAAWGWHADGWLARQPLFKEIPAGGDIPWPNLHRCRVHPCADDTGDCPTVFGHHGRPVAGDSAAHLRADRAYLRAALYGHFVRDHLFQPSDGQFFGRLVGRAHV